jgi:hypothetical protein
MVYSARHQGNPTYHATLCWQIYNFINSHRSNQRKKQTFKVHDRKNKNVFSFFIFWKKPPFRQKKEKTIEKRPKNILKGLIDSLSFVLHRERAGLTNNKIKTEPLTNIRWWRTWKKKKKRNNFFFYFILFYREKLCARTLPALRSGARGRGNSTLRTSFVVAPLFFLFFKSSFI